MILTPVVYSWHYRRKKAQTNLVSLSEHQVQTTGGNISHKSRPQVIGGSIRHKGEDLKTKVNADILNITNPFIYFALKNGWKQVYTMF